MSARAAALIVLGSVLGAWAISRVADAAAAQAETDTTALDYVNPWKAIETMTNQASTERAVQDVNVRAFLTMIAKAEGTEGRGDPYRVCYAYAHTVKDLRDHPAVTGEWRGQRLTDQQCKGTGQARSPSGEPTPSAGMTSITFCSRALGRSAPKSSAVVLLTSSSSALVPSMRSASIAKASRFTLSPSSERLASTTP